MDPGGPYSLPQDPDFWEAMKNQYRDRTAMLLAKEEELRQKIADMETMLSDRHRHESPSRCPKTVPKVFPQMSHSPVRVNVPKIIRDTSPVRFLTPPTIVSSPPPCTPCIISPKKESYSSNFFQKVMENAKSILTMRCNVVSPCNPINEKPTKDEGAKCPCAKGDRKIEKADNSVAVDCDKTEAVTDNTSQEVNTSYSCSPTQSAHTMTDVNKKESSSGNSCTCGTTNQTSTAPADKVAHRGCQCCGPECGSDGPNKVPCKCKHSLNVKNNKLNVGDGSKKKCTNDTCPVILSRSAPNMSDDLGDGKIEDGDGKTKCRAPCDDGGKADDTEMLGFGTSKGDCSCDLQTIKDLVEKEKQIKSQIQSLQERGRSYDNLMGDFHNMASKTTCTCCTIIQQPGGDFDKISKELKLENKLLRTELDEMKMELKHCLNKIQGPMKEKLEVEKCKCISLEDELNKAAKNMIINHESHTREMNALKLQLCNACNNISELNSMNRRLKDEMDSLDCMCAKLEDDLMKQKISEAETIKRLTRRRPEYEEKTVPAIQSGFRCDSNLDVIARKLSNTLRETEPCEECAKLPPELTSAARCIKDLTDMVQQRKKEVEAVMGKTRESGSQSPRTEDVSIQCCKECLDEERRQKPLFDVAPSIPEKDSSHIGTTALETPYFSAEGISQEFVPPPPGPDLVCKRVCDDSEPCKIVGKPCATGGLLAASATGEVTEVMEAKKSYGVEASRPTTMAPAGSAVRPKLDDDDVCKEPCGDTSPCSKGMPCFELVTSDLSALREEPEREGDGVTPTSVSFKEAPSEMQEGESAIREGESAIGEAESEAGPPKDRSTVDTCKTCIEEGICKAFPDGHPSAVSKPSEEVSAIPLDVDASRAVGDAAEQPLEGAPSAAASAVESAVASPGGTPGASAIGSAIGSPGASAAASGVGSAGGTSGISGAASGLGVPSDVSGLPPGAETPGAVSEGGLPFAQPGEAFAGVPGDASGMGMDVPSGVSGGFPGAVGADIGGGTAAIPSGPGFDAAALAGQPGVQGAVVMGAAASGYGPSVVSGAGGLPFKEERTGNFPFEVETRAELLQEPPPDLQVTTTITASGTLEVITEGAGGVIETTLTYRDDGTLEVLTQLTEGKPISPDYTTTEVSEATPVGLPMAVQESIITAGETDLSGGLETVSERSKDTTILSTETEADKVSAMAGTGKISDTETALTEAEREEVSEITEIPIDEGVEEEVVEEAAVSAEVEEEAAVEEVVEEVPVEEAAPEEVIEEAAVEEAEVVAEVAEEVEAAPSVVEEVVEEAEAAPEEVIEEAAAEAAPEEVVEEAPAEAEEAPEEAAVEEAAPEEAAEEAAPAEEAVPAEEGEAAEAEPTEGAEPAEKIGRDICVCPGRPIVEEEEEEEPKEEEGEAAEEAVAEAAEEEGAEEAAEGEVVEGEEAEGEAAEEAAEAPKKPRRRDVCLCDFDEEGKEGAEATEEETTDEGADKAIAEGEPSTEPTEEGEAAAEGEAILEGEGEGGEEPTEGEGTTEGEEGVETAEGEESGEGAEGEGVAAEGEGDAEAAEGEEGAEAAEVWEPNEEDLNECRKIVEEIVERAMSGEYALDTRQKRDYSCQSTAAVDQSCQCCECKNVGVSTTQDSETVTDDMVQEAQKSQVGEDGSQEAEAGDLEAGKVQGTADDVSTLNEESKTSAPTAEGDASEYTTAQDKSECTAPCASEIGAVEPPMEATQQGPLMAAPPSDVKGKCSQFLNEESLEPCQDVGIQCDCAGEIERDDRSEGRVSSGSDTENEQLQQRLEAAKKSGSEVPESVSKLAVGTSKSPSIGSGESGKPRKRRTSRLHNIRCDCPGVCQCVVCAPDVIAKRKALTGSPLPPTGQAGKLCCCLPRPQAPQRSSCQDPSIPPVQMTQAYMQAQMQAHPTGCECGVCICNCTPGPRGRTSINDVFSRQPNVPIPLNYQQPGPSGAVPGHPLDCECVDCLCMPTVRCLANLREVPVVKDEKQVYQVKCVCAKNKASKIPIPTNSPLGPPKAKSNVTCTCEKCSCSPCLSKGEDAKSPESDLAKLCDCKDCQCEVCFNKPKKEVSKKGCCCKGDCTCESCPIEKLAAAAGGGGGGGPGHPEGCDCTDCLCPKSPEYAAGIEAAAAADAAAPAKKQPPPGCDCVECKCPGMAGDDLPKPEGCDCLICACPGREAAVGAAKKMAECDCEPCECSPCADPKKRPEEPAISPCDCPECKCEPCADPNKSGKGAGGGGGGAHSALCDCAQCVCEGQRCLQTDIGVGSVENKATHTPDCICDECLCDTEQHESGCTCPECQCADCIYKTGGKGAVGGDECTCGDCQCKDCSKMKGGSGGEGCTCAVCQCADCIFKKGGAGGEDECKCGDCKCVDCAKKGAAAKPAADEHGDDCTCDDCFFKRRNEADEVCKCGDCLCVDCPKKKDGGGGSKGDAPPAAGAGPCSCIVCECDVCSDPNKKKAGGGGGDKDTCTCATCECTDCTGKKGGGGGGGGGGAAGGCSCKECKCDNCIHKAGAKKGGDTGGKAVGKGCTCTTCICVDCAGQKADGAKAGGKGAGGGTTFTDPPPFTPPSKDSCKCAKCDCVICNGKGGDPASEQCTCLKCECKPCPKKGGGGGGGADGSDQCTCQKCDCPTCRKGGGSKGDSKSEKCTCPKCECLVCPKGGGAAKASGGDAKCTCKKCECSPCSKGGAGKGGSSDAPPFEVPIRQPCTCKNCECISCNKSYVPSKSAAAFATVSKCDCSTCTCTPDEAGKPPVSGKSSKANAGDSCTCPSCACDDCPRDMAGKPKADKGKGKGDPICTCPTPSAHNVSKMGNAELVEKIQKDTKENCECREQIKELKRALDKIKCACTEAEVKASKNKPFVKQASAFGQTMSGLKVALANLQDKCKAKDKMIAVMTDELKLRTSSNTMQKVMNTNRCADALDYDKAEDVQTMESMSTNVIYAVGEEKEMGHTKVRPKSSDCPAPCKDDKRKSKKKVKSHKGKDATSVDLTGFEVVDIRRITQDSIIIKWKPPKSSIVTGYDIFINGVNKSKVMSGGRTSAMIHSLDLSATIQITIYAVTKTGRCEPPAIAIYEINC